MNSDGKGTRKLDQPIKKIYASSWKCGLWDEICYNENSRTGMVIEFRCQLKFNYNHVYDAVNTIMKRNASLRTVFEKEQGILYRNILPCKNVVLRNHISFLLEVEYNETSVEKAIDYFFSKNMKPSNKLDCDNCLWDCKVIMYPDLLKENETSQETASTIQTMSTAMWNYVLLFQCQQYLLDAHSVALLLREFLKLELSRMEENIEVEKEDVTPTLEEALDVKQTSKVLLGGWDEVQSRLTVHFGHVETFIPKDLKEMEIPPELKLIMTVDMDQTIQFQSVLRRSLDISQTKSLHHILRRSGISFMALMQVVLQASFCQMMKSCDNTPIPRNVYIRIEKDLRMLLSNIYDQNSPLGSSKLRLICNYSMNPQEEFEMSRLRLLLNKNATEKPSKLLWKAAHKRQTFLNETRLIATYRSILKRNFQSSLPILPDLRPTLTAVEHFLIDELVVPDELGNSLQFLTKKQRNIIKNNLWPTEKNFQILSRYHVILEPNMHLPTFSFTIFEGKLTMAMCWSRGKGCLKPDLVNKLMDGVVELLNKMTNCDDSHEID